MYIRIIIKNLLPVILLLLAVAPRIVLATDSLERELNCPRTGDLLLREETAYIEPHDVNSLFPDYSGLKLLGNTALFEYFKKQVTGIQDEEDKTESFTFLGEGSLKDFKLSGDVLYLTSMEDPQRRVGYDKPLAVLRYPFAKGEYLKDSYGYEGIYCDRLGIKGEGSFILEADWKGDLILPRGDTVRNVLRTRQLTVEKEVLLPLTPDSVVTETREPLERTTDSYLWYAEGSRYPVLEMKTVTLTYNGQKVGEEKIGYTYTPYDQHADMDDEKNRELLEKKFQEIRVTTGIASSSSSGLTCRPNPVTDYLEVELPATVGKGSLNVYDISGRQMYNREVSPVAGSNLRIDMTAFPSGTYILEMKTDKESIKEKIVKQ